MGILLGSLWEYFVLEEYWVERFPLESNSAWLKQRTRGSTQTNSVDQRENKTKKKNPGGAEPVAEACELIDE